MLPVHDAEGLRPTGDRIRETLFNWLTAEIHGRRCLDLFAGTGALGLEALSRGAEFVQFIEKHQQAAHQLKDNLLNLKAPNASWQLHHGDTLQWLEQTKEKGFDLVFLDPPFAADLWQQTLDALINKQLLANEALIYVESPNETKIQAPSGFSIHKQLKAGSVDVQLYRFNNT